jgi:hypothetical protein
MATLQGVLYLVVAAGLPFYDGVVAVAAPVDGFYSVVSSRYLE